MKATQLQLLIFILLLISCSSSGQDEYPFTKGRQFFYHVERSEPGGEVKRDTISFKVLPHDGIKVIMGVTKIHWLDKSGKGIEMRGLNAKDSSYELQLPTNYALFENEATAIAGHPSASLKSKPGCNSESDHKYYKGYGMLTGVKLIQQHLHVSDDTISWNGNSYPIQRYQSRNVSDTAKYGTYVCTYAFNKDLGFMAMNYAYPRSIAIRLRLFRVDDEKK